MENQRTVLQLAVTHQCNFNCKYCIMRKERDRFQHLELGKDPVTDERYLENFDEIFITGGEPTIHPHFQQICDHLKELSTADIYLYTNGSYLYRVNSTPYLSGVNIGYHPGRTDMGSVVSYWNDLPSPRFYCIEVHVGLLKNHLLNSSEWICRYFEKNILPKMQIRPLDSCPEGAHITRKSLTWKGN